VCQLLRTCKAWQLRDCIQGAVNFSVPISLAVLECPLHYWGLEHALNCPFQGLFFYSYVYPSLKKVHFRSTHFGDWAKPQFHTRVIGDATIWSLRNMFGGAFVKAKQEADLSGYNSDPATGPLCGYLLFLNYHKKFIMVYDHERQVVTFSFSYLIYRWLSEEPNSLKRNLYLVNDEETAFGSSTRKFPVIGQRVRIWWTTLSKSYCATVRKWSKKNQSWILKYDDWLDSTIEDVPVVDWEFIE